MWVKDERMFYRWRFVRLVISRDTLDNDYHSENVVGVVEWVWECLYYGWGLLEIKTMVVIECENEILRFNVLVVFNSNMIILFCHLCRKCVDIILISKWVVNLFIFIWLINVMKIMINRYISNYDLYKIFQIAYKFQNKHWRLRIRLSKIILLVFASFEQFNTVLLH